MDTCLFRDRQRMLTLNIQPSLKTRKASSTGMNYVNTPLTKHEDDEATFTHSDEISDQTRDGLRCQYRVLDGQRSTEHE